MDQVLAAMLTVAAGVLAAVCYFWGSNWLLDQVLPVRVPDRERASGNYRRAAMIRPWLFLAPAVAALGFYLFYPAVASLWLSFHDADGAAFVGMDNYRWLAGDPGFHEAILNNFLWLLVVPTASTILGLAAAALTDRVALGGAARSLIFMPMAVSMVGAAVIWKFVYDYRASGSEQIGLLNALVTSLGFEPQAWIAVPFWNNFLLMLILIWIQTGFAMVILSAALRGIPQETIEAAVMDGASGLQIFFLIIVPQIRGAIAVVWTTIVIAVLKVFDIVLAMTNGQWNTQVLANLMFDRMFRGGGDFGRGATVAIVIMALVVPVMVWNIRKTRLDTEGR